MSEIQYRRMIGSMAIDGVVLDAESEELISLIQATTTIQLPPQSFCKIEHFGVVGTILLLP